MHLGYIRYFTFVIAVTAVVLLSACEDDKRATGIDTTTKAASQQHVSKVDATTTATSRLPGVRVTTNSTGRDSGDEEGHQEPINENTYYSGSVDVYLNPNDADFTGYEWLFPRLTSITVNANSFLDSDGNYVVGDLVFTNCDDLGFYFIALDPAATIWITNCGTTAFP